MSYLYALGSGFPAAVSQRDLWTGYFSARVPVPARRLYHHAGVETRHTVVDLIDDDPSEWTTEQRMARYETEALGLVKQATQHIDGRDVDSLVVVSCTGYSTPGIDIMLARNLGLHESAPRTLVGHMGCHAALPAIAMASDAAVARGVRTLVVCVELSSLHAQADLRDPQQVLTHALFSDAATALCVVPHPNEDTTPTLEILGFASRSATEFADHMRWTITDSGFRMTLSAKVPRLVAQLVPDVVDDLLRSNGVRHDEVRGWAVHPGGPQILDRCAQVLGLGPTTLDASRATLAEHGNCSSATIVMVIERMLATDCIEPDGHLVALAFGPGLTVHGMLLRRTRAR
ncbi:MAG: type III polyketide synthase [Acidimicrobiia bacterium]